MKAYKENINYIGSNVKQKKYTNFIFKRSRDINFIAWVHDTMYELILKLNSWTLFFICSLFVDLIFLIGGVWKALTKLNVFKGLIEALVLIILYILITIYKPIYIWRRNK